MHLTPRLSAPCLRCALLEGEVPVLPPSICGRREGPLGVLRSSIEVETTEKPPASQRDKGKRNEERSPFINVPSALTACSCSGGLSGWKSLLRVSPMSVSRSRRKLPGLSVGDTVRIVFYLEAPSVRCPASEIVSHVGEKWTREDYASQCVSIEQRGEGLVGISWQPDWPDRLFSLRRDNLRLEDHASESLRAPLRSLAGEEPEVFRYDVPSRTSRQTRRDLKSKGRKEKKTRTQAFEGTVISVRPIKGGGDCMYTVRKVYKRATAEKVFFLSSPLVKSFKVLRKFVVRRSKLYYLRGKTGRAAKLRPRPMRSAREDRGGR